MTDRPRFTHSIAATVLVALSMAACGDAPTTIPSPATVADGFLAGGRVHEEGQLVDPENSCFVGEIRIMPATG